MAPGWEETNAVAAMACGISVETPNEPLPCAASERTAAADERRPGGLDGIESRTIYGCREPGCGFQAGHKTPHGQPLDVSAADVIDILSKRDPVAALREEYEAARKVAEQAQKDAEPYKRAEALAWRNAMRLELDVMRAEGRGGLAHAAWIEAWLEHRHEDCDRILQSEEYKREIRSRP